MAVTGHDLDAEFAELKKELGGLSTEASNVHKERTEKIAAMHTHVEEVRRTAGNGYPSIFQRHVDKIAESHENVHQNVSTGHQMSFGLSVAAVAFIFVSGMSLYMRFRCWEKKHCL